MHDEPIGSAGGADATPRAPRAAPGSVSASAAGSESGAASGSGSGSDEHVATVAALIARARAQRITLAAPAGGRALLPAEAYAVQALRTAARLARGERVLGWKLGYTSAAMRAQMGVAEPNLGPLTDAMLLADGDPLPADVLQPRVEPEIALVLGTSLAGDVTAGQALACVASAHAALEVVDSVWTDYRFTWADNTADGSSAAYVVIGGRLPMDDLAALPATLVRNDVPAGSGRGADAMGHPAAALAWLSGQLGERGLGLRAGDIVITGGLTRAVPLDPGDRVSAQVGDVTVAVRRPLG